MTHELNPEYATVGGLLLAPATLREVDGWLRPEDFAGGPTRLTYSLILAMDARKVPVDPVTVQAEMRRQGLVRRDGYPTMELIRMVEAVPVPASTAYYARLVLAESISRGVTAIGERLVQLGSTPREPSDLFAAVTEQLRAVDGARRRWNLASGENARPVVGRALARTGSPGAGVGRAGPALASAWHRVVISIGRLGSAAAAADYYLTRQANCSLDYYTGAGERRGLWIGRGAAALGLAGELTAGHEQVFRGLLEGRAPDGEQLVRPDPPHRPSWPGRRPPPDRGRPCCDTTHSA